MSFIWIILAALLAGLAGSGMSKIILGIFRWKEKFRSSSQHILFVTGCALVLVTAAVFINAGVLGSGKRTDDDHAFYKGEIYRLVHALVAHRRSVVLFLPPEPPAASSRRLLARVPALAPHFPAGCTLAPADTNILILSGMVAFLTGVTRTPLHPPRSSSWK